MIEHSMLCKICGAETQRVGTIIGKLQQRPFYLQQCSNCFFSFISNPWLDYDKIYSIDYYLGKGADPTVDYCFELEHPEATIRKYEWNGILSIVSSLRQLTPETEWLDYGCGNGGLVRFCRAHRNTKIVGYEKGWIKDRAISRGIPFVDEQELERKLGTYDIITAIEVLEHLEDPMDSLRTIKKLLKPGGLFFYTTGNAQPFRNRLLSWNYLIPEIHISFFEPKTLDIALKESGFQTMLKGYLPGHTDIIRFKILKNLRLRTPTVFERVLPWGALSRIADMKYGITAHPVAWA